MENDPKLADENASALRIPVRMADLQQFANRECVYCAGKGERWTTTSTPDTDRKPMKSGRAFKKTTRKTVPCTCGLRGFLRVQKCTQDKSTGQLYFAEPIVAWASKAIHEAAQALLEQPKQEQTP